MITKVFGVYDTKATCYTGSPFCMPTVGSAVRAFSDLANDKQSSINRHPTDYILMQLADFDDQTGKFETLSTPKNLGLASDFIEIKTLPNPEQFNLPLPINGKPAMAVK